MTEILQWRVDVLTTLDDGSKTWLTKLLTTDEFGARERFSELKKEWPHVRLR